MFLMLRTIAATSSLGSSSPGSPRRFFFHCLTLMTKALQSFKTSGTTHPTTQCQTPEDLKPQQHHFHDIKSCNASLIPVGLHKMSDLHSLVSDPLLEMRQVISDLHALCPVAQVLAQQQVVQGACTDEVEQLQNTGIHNITEQLQNTGIHNITEQLQNTGIHNITEQLQNTGIQTLQNNCRTQEYTTLQNDCRTQEYTTLQLLKIRIVTKLLIYNSSGMRQTHTNPRHLHHHCFAYIVYFPP
jgi:hypothetical protein